MKKNLFAVVLILIWLIGTTVHADENNDKLLSLVHNGANNYFEFEAFPGETMCFDFILMNESDETVTNYILIYDSLTAVNGGNIIMSPEEYFTDETASWFTINEDKITMKPGRNMVTRVCFSVPENTIPGEYTAILALYSDNNEEVHQNASQEEVGVIINRYYTSTLAIVIRVGEQPERMIGFTENVDFVIQEDSGRSFLYIPIENSGYTYEFPKISISIKDDRENILFEDSLTMDIVYMKTDAYACFETTGSINEAGVFSMEAVMSDSMTGVLLDKKDYGFNVGKKDVKKTLEKHVEVENRTEPGWGSGFYIFERKYIYMAGGVSAALILSLLGLLLFKKSK